jgi:hypothetical protein
MLKAIQRFLMIVLLVMAALYLAYEGYSYRQSRDLMPPGTVIAGVNVAGLNRDEAIAALNEHYYSAVELQHQAEYAPLYPAEVGFVIDAEAMVQQVEALREGEEPWLGFAQFLLKRPFDPVQIELLATHDPDLLLAQLQTIALLMDRPAQPAQISAEAQIVKEAQTGISTDITASLPAVEAALYQFADRTAELVVTIEEAPELNSMEILKRRIEQQLQGFDGAGIIFVMNLETGEEISINGDVPVSGLSILKVAIFVETYRVLDSPPDEYVQNLLLETATLSSNFGANLLLHIIAGENNTYEGAAVLTEEMQALGLVNTYMVIPYDSPEVATRPTTYVTPANSRPNDVTVPDPARQTTAEDMGTLLSMIYYCANGGGGLAAVYPGEITPTECQAIIDLMIGNTEGNLIRFGVPDDVAVSHKHGWDGVTHGDAGIVLSPNADYVIVEYLHQPGEWLVSDISFPILREVSRTVYNHFNPDDPYVGDALFEEERFDEDDPFFQNPENLPEPEVEEVPETEEAPPTESDS